MAEAAHLDGWKPAKSGTESSQKAVNNMHHSEALTQICVQGGKKKETQRLRQGRDAMAYTQQQQGAEVQAGQQAMVREIERPFIFCTYSKQ